MQRRQFLQTTVGTAMTYCFGSTYAQPKSPLPQHKRPNILWIMFDDGRADALGCYGKSWAHTPNMDWIAQRGVRFQTAIIQNTVCVPSRTSMKTGRYPHDFGIMAMGKPTAVPAPYLHWDIIRKIRHSPYYNLLEYWTAVGMKPVNVGKIHAFAQSWDRRGDVPPLLNVNGQPTLWTRRHFKNPNALIPQDAVYTKTHHWLIGGTLPIKPQQSSTWRMGDLAVKTLTELADRNKPFFLRVSFHAPHVPCTVPKSYMIDPASIHLPLPDAAELKSKPEFERKNLQIYSGAPDLTLRQIGIARGTYYGMVSLADRQVGRLLEILKRKKILDNTIIVINSDQGFQLGEHGLWKKRVFYEQNVCVPFIISCPSLLPVGKVIDEPVEMIDFLPTLMDLSGIEVPSGINGRSLMPLIRGQVKTWNEACFSEIDHSTSMYEELRHTGRRVMVRTRQWKLIFFMDTRVKNKDGALYNLKTDPGETKNLYNNTKYKSVVQHLEQLAHDWARKT